MGAPIKNLSRAEAKRLGIKRYYDGKKCPHGHLSYKLVSNYTCVKCLHEKYFKVRKIKRKQDIQNRLIQSIKLRGNSELPSNAIEAKFLGSKLYFTGKQCPHGHTSPRYSSGHTCSVCVKSRQPLDIDRERIRKKLYARKHWPDNRRKYKQRYHSDIQFKLRSNIRSRIKHAIKGHTKTTSALVYLGCTISEVKSYLESKFQPGMSWKNHAHIGWHIDHIIPLSSFDMTDEAQRMKAFNYKNLQPLWARDNHIKSNKIPLFQPSV